MENIALIIATSSLGLHIGEKYKEMLSEKLAGTKYQPVLVAEHNVESAPQAIASVVFVATGGTEHVIAELARKSKFTLLLYTDEYNSLPAVIEALAFLRSKGFRAEAKNYSELGDLKEYLGKLERVATAYKKLSECSFGLIGGVSPWLMYSRVEEPSIRERGFGKLVYVDMEELYKEYEKADVSEELASSVEKLFQEVHVERFREELVKALKVYKALEAIIEKHKLCGFTIKCFDLIRDKDTTACLAVSLFNSKLIPAGCEGDVPLLYSLAIGMWITGKPAFMGNPAAVYRDELVIAHCTSWCTGKCYAYTHFESGRGIGIRAEYPVGEYATVYRLTPDLKKLRLGVGIVAEHEWSQAMCRTQVRIKLKNAEKVVAESIGNHYAVLLGNHSDELRLFARIAGLEVEEL